jgi:hypothetical protein
MESEKDKQLWKIAKRRVEFKWHLGAYIIVNAMLWAIWYFSGEREQDEFPWPVWCTFGWGIGLAFDFLGTYWGTKHDSIEREYEKLKGK